jgi:hypothetical protein
VTGDARNAAVTMALFGSFAALITVHVASLFGIAKQKAYGQAAGALVFPPLAPFFAFSRGMHVRAIMWCLFAAAYLVAFLTARTAW